MITFMLFLVALIVGGVFGYLIAWTSTSSAPPRPEALTATPEEIVAVYEARREMSGTGFQPVKTGKMPVPPDDDLVMVDYFPMSRKALKWEREQAKKDRKRAGS